MTLNQSWHPLLEDLEELSFSVSDMPNDHEDSDDAVPTEVELPDNLDKLECCYERLQLLKSHGEDKSYRLSYRLACQAAGIAQACRELLDDMEESKARKLTTPQKAAAKKLWPLIISRPGSSWSREMSVLVESADMNVRLIYSTRIKKAFPDMPWNLVGSLDVLVD